MAAIEVAASVLHGSKDLRLETRTLEPPGPGEVQVGVHATGLCGSDLHYYAHGRNGDIVMREPLTLGHESAGLVVAVGSDVSGLSVGDRVALEVGVPCGACQYCTTDRYNLCPQMRFRSSAKSFPHFQGTLQTRINHPAKWCWRLPDALSYDHGALIEPLSVALHALDRANIPADEKLDVLVFGAGAVGALTAAALRLRFPKVAVVIADVDEGRVTFAVKNHFAHHGFTVPMQRGSTIDEKLAIATDNAKQAKAQLKPDGEPSNGYDLIFECTGQEICLQTSIYATKPGGKVLMIGMGTPIQTLPLSAAALREVDLLGVFRYNNTYARCIDLLQKAAQQHSAGEAVPDVTKLITHRVRGLGDVPRAFELASRPKDTEGNMVVKVFIETSD